MTWFLFELLRDTSYIAASISTQHIKPRKLTTQIWQLTTPQTIRWILATRLSKIEILLWPRWTVPGFLGIMFGMYPSSEFGDLPLGRFW